jgi:hypothetical protein
MYGLLLENLAAFIKIQWGEGKWESVRRHAGVDAPSFSVHHVYAETLIPRLARSAIQVIQLFIIMDSKSEVSFNGRPSVLRKNKYLNIRYVNR